MMAPGLEPAYRRTIYRARSAAGEIELGVGERSPALDAELAVRGPQHAFLAGRRGGPVELHWTAAAR